jgi:hypothetical protein
LLLVCLLMAPPSQELEPPANPERFRFCEVAVGERARSMGRECDLIEAGLNEAAGGGALWG